MTKKVTVSKALSTGIWASDFRAKEKSQILRRRVLAYTVICAIGLIVAILCVRGAFTDERLYILPYLVFHAMVLVVLAILFFIMISTVPSSTQRSPSIVERLASIRTASPLDGSQVLGIICSLFVSLCIGVSVSP
ncbi:uncharacterized protein ISCGN_027125 [Ixodes scapularis]